MESVSPASCFNCMRFLILALCCAFSLSAAPKPKTGKLALPPGPVKAALKKNYKLHMARNFVEEAEKELQVKYRKKHGT